MRYLLALPLLLIWVQGFQIIKKSARLLSFQSAPSQHRRSFRTTRSYHNRGDTSSLDNSKRNLPLRFYRAWFQKFHTTLRNLCQRIHEFLRAGTFTVYVLECEEDKYYVGSTSNLKRRFQEHVGSRGSKWTSLYKPIRVMQKYSRIPAAYHLGMEAKVTAEIMLEHGINNVRGAMFSEPRNYTLEDVRALTGFLGHYNELSYDEVSSRLVIDLSSVDNSSLFGEYSKKNRRRKAKRRFKSNDVCFNCGKKGHWANDCPQQWGSLNNTALAW